MSQHSVTRARALEVKSCTFSFPMSLGSILPSAPAPIPGHHCSRLRRGTILVFPHPLEPPSSEQAQGSQSGPPCTQDPAEAPHRSYGYTPLPGLANGPPDLTSPLAASSASSPAHCPLRALQPPRAARSSKNQVLFHLLALAPALPLP